MGHGDGATPLLGQDYDPRRKHSPRVYMRGVGAACTISSAQMTRDPALGTSCLTPRAGNFSPRAPVHAYDGESTGRGTHGRPASDIHRRGYKAATFGRTITNRLDRTMIPGSQADCPRLPILESPRT